MCVGDWDNDGIDEVLAVDGADRLQVITVNGQILASLQLPEAPAFIELGRNSTDGPRLLAYRIWGHQVSVFNGQGQLQWTYGGDSGVDGAHWG